MKKLFTLFALLLSLAGISSHFGGGYLRAQYQGPSTNGKLNYQIEYYVIWVGPTNGYTPTIDIVSNSSTSSVQLTLDGSVPYGLMGQGYELIKFKSTVQLSANTEYTFSYESCCRPPGVMNIGNGLSSAGYGFFIWSTLNTGTGNSHPELIAPPACVVASGRDYTQSIRAYDKDGDVVSYTVGKLYESNINTEVPLSSFYVDTAAILPNTIILPTGMLIYQYSLSGGFSNEGFSIGYKIISKDQAGQVNSIINMDWPLWVSSDSLPSQNKPTLLLDSLFTHPSRYDFRLNRADTIGFHLSTNSQAGLFIPTAFNIVQRFQRMVTISYPFSGAKWLEFTITPTANDVGREIPAVLRFEVSQYYIDYHFDFSVVTGIGADEFNTSNVVVYPNPTQDFVRVRHTTEISSISIIDASGREVGHEAVSGRGVEVEMPSEAGLYFLKIEDSAGHVIVEPVLVQ